MQGDSGNNRHNNNNSNNNNSGKKRKEHQSNHYKATHAKAKHNKPKSNSINALFKVGQPGSHLRQHQQQKLKLKQRRFQRSSTSTFNRANNNNPNNIHYSTSSDFKKKSKTAAVTMPHQSKRSQQREKKKFTFKDAERIMDMDDDGFEDMDDDDDEYIDEDDNDSADGKEYSPYDSDPLNETDDYDQQRFEEEYRIQQQEASSSIQTSSDPFVGTSRQARRFAQQQEDKITKRLQQEQEQERISRERGFKEYEEGDLERSEERAREIKRLRRNETKDSKSNNKKSKDVSTNSPVLIISNKQQKQLRHELKLNNKKEKKRIRQEKREAEEKARLSLESLHQQQGSRVGNEFMHLSRYTTTHDLDFPDSIAESSSSATMDFGNNSELSSAISSRAVSPISIISSRAISPITIDSSPSITISSTTADLAPAHKRDEMQTGADFISFDEPDSPSTSQPPTPSDWDEQAEASSSTAAAAAASTSKKGKRKREPDYPSDTEGATGPPAGAPWMGHRRYSKLKSIADMLTAELEDFVKFIGPSREEHRVRQYAFRRVENAIKSMWPQAKVMLFGSFDTMLYLPTSDLDVVVLMDSINSKHHLHDLASSLRRRNIGTNFTVLTKTRVPLVKFRESLSDIPVDISFNLTNGIQSAAMVKEFLTAAPVLRSLTLIVKFFLMIKGQNEVFTGGIGSYTTMIMILSFLQMHPLIQTGQIKPEENLGVLLVEFFELYGSCFNYDNVGISVVNGGSYFQKSRDFNNYGGGGRATQMLLCSLDPNDLENDTGKSSYNLRAIRENFVGAFGVLTRRMQTRHDELFGHDQVQAMAVDENNNNKNDDDDDNDDDGEVRRHKHKKQKQEKLKKKKSKKHVQEVSLIQGVLAVPYKVMEHRQHVERVFYSGKFQELFNHPPGLEGLDQMDKEERKQAKQERKAKRAAKRAAKEEKLAAKTATAAATTTSSSSSSSSSTTATIVLQHPDPNGEVLGPRTVPLKEMKFVPAVDSEDSDELDESNLAYETGGSDFAFSNLHG